jgi:hypothetical protein
MQRQLRFVVDGEQRARKALVPLIRAEVEAEYAQRLEQANLALRLLLRQEMRREINRRVEQRAPCDAHY